MSDIWDDDPICTGVEFEAYIMQEFERGFNKLCNNVRYGLYPQQEGVETLKHNQYNKLFDMSNKTE